MKRREEAESALAATLVAQDEFWRCLQNLEFCLRIELDSTVDFRDVQIDSLLNESN